MIDIKGIEKEDYVQYSVSFEFLNATFDEIKEFIMKYEYWMVLDLKYKLQFCTNDLERLSNWVFTYREDLVMSSFLFGYTNINAAKEYIVMSGFKDKIGEIL